MNNVSPLINFFIEQGVPLETVVLLLMLPVVVTLIAFFRQIVGIKAFGIYTPAIVTFAFLAVPQLRYGVVVFVSVILVGMLMRFALKSFRILYLPRVAITLSVIAFAILFLLGLGGYFQRTGLASVTIFPILIMITIVEKFVVVQIEKGNKAAMILALETLVISLAGYYLASWPMLVRGIIAFPWLILITIPINIFLGKWDGLRLTEYVRFWEVLKNLK
jgi:hypothetical protein